MPNKEAALAVVKKSSIRGSCSATFLPPFFLGIFLIESLHRKGHDLALGHTVTQGQGLDLLASDFIEPNVELSFRSLFHYPLLI
jgi:hypothetical protein